MPRVLDTLELAEDKRLSVVADGDALAAIPEARRNGVWRRAVAGDGVAEALLGVLSRGSAQHGAFSVISWTSTYAHGERAMGVDQTNESVIVGDAAVVKWATHLAPGPHPAPRRIGVLREAGFAGMPAPWALVTWKPPGGTETLVASVDDYLPGAVDGWTWAVEEITAAARDRRPEPFIAATTAVGTVVAELHAALSATATVASRADAARWTATAFDTLETVCTLGDSAAVCTARARRGDLETILNGLDGLAGIPVIEGHGDLHVGQVLRSENRYMVTDFDGNPVLPAEQRMLPIPTALDVAGMAQSLAHVAIVASKYTPLDPTALADVDRAGRVAFKAAYLERLTDLGHRQLYDPRPLHALRTQQTLREIIYAARYLPRWLYVPDAALPDLLDQLDPLDLLGQLDPLGQPDPLDPLGQPDPLDEGTHL